jgi:hypothetical protein
MKALLYFSLIASALGAAIGRAESPAGLKHFITARGDQLYEDEKPFRFISVNIPNLQLVEDNFAPGATTAWAWPNEFELTDALESVRQMGGTVVRTYVLSVRREGSDMGEHVYVRGPGDFNEDAFRALDLALEIASRKGIRLIIPLVDNWKWQGGIGEYAAFRGRRPEDFWTDEQVIADFENTVRHVLTRINTRTGVAYRDDPAILAWETGNELDSTPEWTRRIAALMKSLDPNHLVADGYSLHGIRDESIADPNIDLVTTHHYPNADATDYVTPILAAREKTRGKKPYFVGEFGFVPAAEVHRVYEAVIDSGVTGALLWSLRFHQRNGGFYWHSEPSGGKLYKAYHWPGFDTGKAYDERQVVELTRNKAYQIRRLAVPAVPPPGPPTLLPISDVSEISWQGSAGALGYTVERAEPMDGPWIVIAEGVDDSSVQYRPLFNDESAEPGRSYYYRVTAMNDGGKSTASNVVGPVHTEHRTLVDEGQDLSRIAGNSEGVKLTAGEDRRRGEDIHRIAIPAGGSVTYRVAQPIYSWRAIVFRVDSEAAVNASTSSDGADFKSLDPNVTARPAGVGDYNYLGSFELAGASYGPEACFLRLSAIDGQVEISRVVIRYGRKAHERKRLGARNP